MPRQLSQVTSQHIQQVFLIPVQIQPQFGHNCAVWNRYKRVATNWSVMAAVLPAIILLSSVTVSIDRPWIDRFLVLAPALSDSINVI